MVNCRYYNFPWLNFLLSMWFLKLLVTFISKIIKVNMVLQIVEYAINLNVETEGNLEDAGRSVFRLFSACIVLLRWWRVLTVTIVTCVVLEVNI